MSERSPVTRALTALRSADLADAAVADHVVLDYEARFFRRKGLTTEGGERILADLPQTMSLDEGDALELEDGRLVGIRAAPEPLLQVSGAELPRLAWHIGNRHTPCQITDRALFIRQDKVIAEMLRHLGADLAEVMAPFLPEGGAYGHGRTHSHEHGATLHDGSGHTHDHDHAHSHDHHHAHPHDHAHAHSHDHAHAHSHDHAPHHAGHVHHHSSHDDAQALAEDELHRQAHGHRGHDAGHGAAHHHSSHDDFGAMTEDLGPDGTPRARGRAAPGDDDDDL